MTEAARLADEIRRSYAGEAWHGPALKELLDDVTPDVARSKPLTGAHSIWEIVLHVTVWIELASEAIEGMPLPTIPFPGDWPPIKDDWAWTKNRLRDSVDRLVELSSGLKPDFLPKHVPGRSYPFSHLLSGITQHNLYHAGQIALLKKAFQPS